MRLSLLAVAVAGVALSGCATKISPEQAQGLITAFHNAGCGGSADVTAGAATGQVGGEAHVSVSLHGTCPQAPQPAPLTTGQVVTATTPAVVAPVTTDDATPH